MRSHPILTQSYIINIIIFKPRTMSQEQQPQQQLPIQPQDPEYQIEEHIRQRRRVEIQSTNFQKLISQNVNEFRSVMDGTVYAYTGVKVRNAGLVEIGDGIKEYQYLRKIDFGMNLFTNISALVGLKYVTHLDLSRNLLRNIQFLSKQGIFPYLKSLNVMGNKIQSMPVIVIRSLRKINLNNNLIKNLDDFDGHQILEIIQLRGNKLKNLKGMRKLPNLKQLFLAENQITTLKDIEKVDNLLKIHCRKNKITNLSDFPHIPKLVYLNLRENQLSKVDDLIGVGQSIKNINLLGNPLQVEFGENTKKQVWMKLRNFMRINKNQVTEEEKQEFDKEYRERLAEQEKERLEKEEAEREAREQQELEEKEKQIEKE